MSLGGLTPVGCFLCFGFLVCFFVFVCFCILRARGLRARAFFCVIILLVSLVDILFFILYYDFTVEGMADSTAGECYEI